MPKKHSRSCFSPLISATLILTCLGLIFISSPWWSPVADRIHRKIKNTIAPPPPIVSEPDRNPPLPDRFYPKARMMTMPLAAGLDIRLNIVSQQGDIASVERANEDAYSLDTRLTYRVPRAATKLEELEQRETPLSKYWPELGNLLKTATISPYYHSLYERKITFLGMRIDHIREIPRRHNMFDCDTILELTSANKQSRGLLIQADMDTVTDGSDSDRTLEIDTSSPSFQPFTAYNWAKRSKTPNPLSDTYRAEADTLEDKLSSGKLNDNDRYIANRRLSFLRRSLEALKYRSSLVAALDPFIVVPIFMVQTPTSHQPSVGDYCLVFYGDLVLPGIVGDTGPNSKIGEASLKVAQKINPELDGTARTRPVSSLGVTYLIFPGSAENEMSPPNLEVWLQRCRKLFGELGGNPEVIQSWTAVPDVDTPLTDQTPSPDSSDHIE